LFDRLFQRTFPGGIARFEFRRLRRLNLRGAMLNESSAIFGRNVPRIRPDVLLQRFYGFGRIRR
jgi:hypothetical protein